jgi:hypothetical protein
MPVSATAIAGRYVRSLDEIPAEELAAIRENLRWFRRFTPRERLRIAKEHADLTLRLRRMTRGKGAGHAG